MNPSSHLNTRLHSLVIFRSLLQTPVMQALQTLLCCNTQNTDTAVNAYCAFAAELFAHSDNFSRYLLNYIVEDENIYMLQCCKKDTVSTSLTACLEHELALLQDLSAFDGNEIRKVIDFDGFLPQWKTEPLDFAEIYQNRIANIHSHGYGIFAKYHTFVIQDGKLAPVKHPDTQSLEQLSGYERERSKVIANTRALLEGRPANNVLLYGDAGTGKSSTVKAIANAFKGEGLRLIEVKKNQLYQIPDIVETLSANPLKFILFIDDLSFSSNDNDFAALKAILEGSVSARGSNLAVYATSNRRHLVKESFSDRDGDEIHLADTMQELMSLSARFGLTITYSRPDKDLYCSIVRNLAEQYAIVMPEEQLMIKAEAHAIRNGGRSPRVAKQFIELLKAGV